MRYPLFVLALAVFFVLLMGCIATVVWLAPWTDSLSSLAMSPSNPNMTAEPDSGGPGTQVTLKGSGFPASARVTVHLGPPNTGATPNSYGEAMTDPYGNLLLTFRMPAVWPDGTPITEPNLAIVALAGQGEAKAFAEFSYSSQTAPAAQLEGKEPSQGFPLQSSQRLD